MALDTSKIAGYAEMTAEQKVAALENFSMPEPDYSGYVKKDVFDKTASELAEMKKSAKASMTAEEQRNAEFEALRTELETMKIEKAITETMAEYVAMGYDDKLARSTAEAIVNGDTKTVLKNQRTFLENHDKEHEASLLKGTTRPEVGNASTGMTVEEIMKISDYAARQKAIAENIDLFQ